MHQQLAPETPWPETVHFSWNTLKYVFKFNSWEAKGLVKALYYLQLVATIVVLLTMIVVGFATYGGLAMGIMTLIFGVPIFYMMTFVARISAEVVLSYFSMRDNLSILASGGSLPAAQQPQVQPQFIAQPEQPQVYQGQPVYQGSAPM